MYLLLLVEDGIAGLPDKTGRQLAQERAQAGLQRHNLVAGQILNEIARQHLLRSTQCLGLQVVKACQCCANDLSAVVLEWLCQQKFGHLCGQFDQLLARFRRAEGRETGRRYGLVPLFGDGFAATAHNLP
jgi:hypothetical protein